MVNPAHGAGVPVHSATEVMLPFFSDAIPPRVFAVLSGVAVAGAFVARLMAQQKADE